MDQCLNSKFTLKNLLNQCLNSKRLVEINSQNFIELQTYLTNLKTKTELILGQGSQNLTKSGNALVTFATTITQQNIFQNISLF